MKPVIGIITNNQHGVFQRNIIAGIRAVAAQRGFDLLIDSYAEDEARPRPITLDYRRVQGVVVIANAAPVDLLRQMYEAGVPVSLASHQVPGLPIPAVITDNEQGMAELARHMVERCQRRKLVFIRGLHGQRDADERETTLVREMLRYDVVIPPEFMLRGDFSPQIAAHSLERLLATGADFDGVIAADYLMAMAAVETLRAAGTRVPDEVAVVGFGDAPEAEAASLTTVAADVVEQGRRTACQLIGQIEGLPIRGVTVLSVRLLIRKTAVGVPHSLRLGDRP